MNYYNEWDKSAAAWLRELIKAGVVPPGDVDERSITEVQPGDLQGYTQCHFFAGIGGWPYALQLAGWATDRPVWTGSCPCQPFSAAGKQKGHADERHLWPEMFRLIRECRPDTVFGEQVASAIGHGWLDGISADLEREGYTCGAVVLGAHSVGAPHIRQRLYWVADSKYQTARRWRLHRPTESIDSLDIWASDKSRGSCTNSRLVDTTSREAQSAAAVGLHTEPCGGSGLGDADIQGPQGWPAMPERGDQRTPWASGVAIPCADGKSRRVEPSIQLLAHGVPARVVRLRGYGNAIVPQVAAEFIGAYMDAIK